MLLAEGVRYGGVMFKEEILEVAMSVIAKTGGYFVFSGKGNKQYVLSGKKDFDKLQPEERQSQLSLNVETVKKSKDESVDMVKREEEKVSADEILGRINRDIALYRLQEEEDMVLDVEEVEMTSKQIEPKQRVRFEPLKGDLPPELQE